MNPERLGGGMAVVLIGAAGCIAVALATLGTTVPGWTATCLLLVMAVVALGVQWGMRRRLRRALEPLVAGARRLAEGDFGWRQDRPTPGMPGALAEALDRVAKAHGEHLVQLRLDQNELQSILQAMPTGVIALGGDGRVLNMNPAAVGLLGLESTDVRGRAIESLGVDDELCRDVRRALESGRAQTTERALGDADRSIIVRSEPTHMQASGPRGLVLMLEDVTHVRRLERMRTEFASNVSHELRTPITSIQGYAELLATDPDGDDRVSHARIIERNAARLSAIIEDLLALARLEESGGGGALENEVLAVHELLGEVTHATAQEAASRDCVLEVQCTEHLEVRGIRPLLEQALGNLVVNAVRYGPESSKVTLSAGLSDQGEVCLSVSDRGPGIAPAHLERIFERFYRVDRGRSREVGGTGLGLAIVKHIAQAHGGRVELASVEGQGSTFTIVLPASGEGAQAGERDLSAVLTHS